MGGAKVWCWAICAAAGLLAAGCSGDEEGGTPEVEAVTLAPGDVMWIDTPVIEHDRDFHSYADYLNPEVPANWVSPVNFADGTFTLRVQLLEMSDPEALPIYYLVGWEPGDPDADGYVRGGVKIDEGAGVYEVTREPIKNFQRVENGVDAGAVGDAWDWTRAFRSPNGDAWDANDQAELYPFKVKVTMVLHPAQ